MPLQNYLPTIDDRRYDDIMTEIRTRIARYTPEWTDLNDNDPGIALAQVFAWLTEMLIYRLGKVPDLNYLKFLLLLGIELQPAEPAQVEITFPLLSSFPDPYLIIPEHTQVAAEAPGSAGPPLVFETDRALIALAARLDAVQTYDGYAYTDISAENAQPDATEGFEPFGSLASVDSALLLGFNYAGDFPQLQLDLAFWTLENEAEKAGLHNCNVPQTQAYPSATIVWEYWNGSEWRPMGLMKDETLAFTRSGHIYLKTPARGQMQRAVIGQVTTARYWLRAHLTQTQYERPPRLLALRTNTVSARQAETVQDEVLGGSDGTPDQIFQLASVPVLQGTLVLEIDQGDGFQPWTEVDDFSGATPSDLVYVLNRTSGQIRLGNGVHGSIAVLNIANPTANVVARQYRFGGGRQGNVTAGSIKTLLTSVSGMDENRITNLLAASGGSDEETLDQAKSRAPETIKSRCRAVTSEDFEFLATRVANIRRAKALPLFHPSFSPDVKVPGVVTVIVVPDSEAPNPLPSDGTLNTVCVYLNQRRLLTTELYVIRPVYARVQIQAEVIVNDNADLAEVGTGIEQALLNYFHPLKGGEDGLGWPFGGSIYYSRVYQRVFTVPGVQSIERLIILLNGIAAPECQNVPLQIGALTYSTEHMINASYAFSNL